MNLSCVAFFCSLQNRWGRGIPYSENLFSIPLNSPLRNAEQLEDFVSVIFLCPFVGGETFEIWQLPGGWEKNWGPFVYTDPGYGKLANKTSEVIRRLQVLHKLRTIL